MNCIPSPSCDCGAPKDVFHFLLICPRFAALRTSMVASIMLARRIGMREGKGRRWASILLASAEEALVPRVRLCRIRLCRIRSTVVDYT